MTGTFIFIFIIIFTSESQSIYKDAKHRYLRNLHSISTMVSSAPNMPILIIPDTRLRSPYTVLPKSFIGDFLELNGVNAHCTEPTSISGPLRMNDVKCILQLTVKIVSSAFPFVSQL